jgi:hypothetical protein
LKALPFFLEPAFLEFQGKHFLVEADACRIAVFGDSELESPLKAPFGGFALPENASPASIRRIIDKVDHYASGKNALSLEIQLPPECYAGAEKDWLMPLLESAGFQKVWTDLNFHLPVDGPIRRHLHRSERWKLNKSERLGFTFHRVLRPEWSQVHAFILASRIRKGYSLSMTPDELRESVDQFPGRYRAWQVLSPANELAAIAVSIDVSSEIEYVFYTADDPVFRKWSPVVMLIAGIYEAALAEKKQLLDLGTASLKGMINPGLAAFKQFLGGLPSSKHRIRKTYFHSEVNE